MSLDLLRNNKLLKEEEYGGVIHTLFNLIISEDHVCN